MSESLFYNRDTNISGVTVPSKLSGLSLTPSYGSTVQFKGVNNSYVTDNYYNNIIPLSVNSLGAKFSLKYEVNETNAQKLVAFFEDQSGYLPIEFAPDNSGIYKTTSGFCDNYAVNFVNNQHFEVAAGIVVDRAPTLLNWANGNFANVPLQGWVSGASYSKYDVVYYPFNAGLTANKNKLDNFYYCSGDHASSTPINSPTGTTSLWSQKFFFDPNIGTQNDVKIKADVLHYKNSFAQHFKTNENIATFDMSYTYSNISDHQLKSMLHFLEKKGAYRRFEHQIPSVYNRPKVYYCPTWSHTWNYFNSNTLTVDLVEDPLGVIPKEVSASPAWNTAANAYVEVVEAHPTHAFTFSTDQKVAISIFFDALDNHGLSSKIKKMWLVGFNPYGGLVNVMDPTDVETWSVAPLDTDMHNGYATFSSAKIVTTSTLLSLGLDNKTAGAFFAGTDMAVSNMNYIYGNATAGSYFQFVQAGSKTAARFGFTPSFNATAGEKQDGVYVGSRNGDNVSFTRIKAARVAENRATVEIAEHLDAAKLLNTLSLWGGHTVGDVSTLGLTLGLTAAQTETLAGLLYDLCVGIGHTALITQDS